MWESLVSGIRDLAGKCPKFWLKMRTKRLCKRASAVQAEIGKLCSKQNRIIDGAKVREIKENFKDICNEGCGKLFCSAFSKKFSELKDVVKGEIERAKQRQKDVADRLTKELDDPKLRESNESAHTYVDPSKESWCNVDDNDPFLTVATDGDTIDD